MPASTQPIPFIRGVNFGFLGKRGYLRDPRHGADLERMKALGIDTVALNIAFFQETFASTRVFLDVENTPDDLEIIAFTEACHRAGLKVILRPVLECWDSTPRKNIQFPPDGIGHLEGVIPRYWENWFRSFTAAMVHFARLAESSKAVMLSLNCEMAATEHLEKDWASLVEAVRRVYSGLVIYSTFPSGVKRDWYHLLDQIHFSFYAEAPAGIEEELGVLQGYAEHYQKPVVLGEFGLRSFRKFPEEQSGGDFNWTGEYDGPRQETYFHNVLSRVWEKPWCGGALYWKWDENQDRKNFKGDPRGDMGLTIQGKPAEETLRKWFTREDRAHF
jgi:hypothetical protein